MENIVIVGGGTSGWMAAISIASRFPKMRITVVDPKVISPIGVGESVTGTVLAFVGDARHGLSMAEFFRRCDVTLKAGIWYRDWQGPGTDYLTPIDSPADYFKHRYPSYIEDFYALVAAEGARLGDMLFYARLIKRNRTDYFRNDDGGVNAQNAQMSCHFDALKFGAWLQEGAVLRENIHHVDDVVQTFELDAESGYVTKIRTRAGRDIEGDFFIDCTGFHRLLFAKAYRPAWKSYADHIRVDSAIPCFAPYEPGEPLPNYTSATAMRHGWMWRIPTQSRFGKGYIFSSKHVDDADAIAELRAAGVDPGESPRIIRFEPGRFEKQWIHNVCAIGLAGGFIEPLEASTVHGIYVQLRLLTELFLPFCSRDAMPSLSRQFNQLMTIALDDYVDFISFHYHCGRNDTPFWRECQEPQAITAANQFRIEKWRHSFPIREDFAGIHTQRVGHTVGLTIWAPMLCAMGYFRKEHAQRTLQMCPQPQMLRENAQRYLQIRDRICATALTNDEAIRFLREQP